MNRRPFVVNRDSDTEHVENHGPSFGRVMAEIRDEIRDFVQTRVQMFKSELQEKISVWKAGTALAAAAVVLLATAYLLLTISLVLGQCLSLVFRLRDRWRRMGLDRRNAGLLRDP